MRKKNFNRHKQNFNGLNVLHSEDVFDKGVPRKGVKIVARLGMDQPYLTHYNVKTGKQRYFSSLDFLPSNLKNKVVDEFSSSKGKKKRSVLYLADK
jgi:hypothetical protein